jgi:Cu/Ag efflux protein CusF
MKLASAKPWLVRLAAVTIVALPVSIACVRMGRADAQTPLASTYETRGQVKSFGPNKQFVNIAHEKIEGYMNAMTMSFEPRSAEQLADLQAGDRVRLSFTETDDGRRLINRIQKE